MKELKGWDAYVEEAKDTSEELSLRLPLTEDEVYVIEYPSRKQGRLIAEAHRDGDMDRLLVALLGEEAGKRVADLSEDKPRFVLEGLLVDVMRKFGFMPEAEDEPGKAEPTQTADAPKSGKQRTKSSAASN
jgi:hypothetical protein